MVERQQIETKEGSQDLEPPGWKEFAAEHPDAVWHIGGLPGDPARPRALTPNEVAAAPPAADGDGYVRDKRGVAHAIRVPAVLRDGFLCGDRQSIMQFRFLAEAAGRAFRGLPPDVLSMFPAALAAIPRKQRITDRRCVFGEVTGPRPGWMGQGWQGGMAVYEKGVIVDFTEAGAGSRDGAELWLLVLHQLGWLGNRNSLVKANRYFWYENHTVAYELIEDGRAAQVGDPLTPVIAEVPKDRFFSRFGETHGRPADVCWVSKWALDELLATAGPAVTAFERMREQLRRVEDAKSPKVKGSELEGLMQLLFNSVDGFQVRDSNVRTKTEEIDLVLDNRCAHHPWNKEKAIMLVECKNWSKPAGKNEITLFESKIKNRRGRCTIGFFVAWAGFARTVEKQLLRSSQDNWMIVLLDGAQIKSAIETGGFTQLLDSAWYAVLKI